MGKLSRRQTPNFQSFSTMRARRWQPRAVLATAECSANINGLAGQVHSEDLVAATKAELPQAAVTNSLALSCSHDNMYELLPGFIHMKGVLPLTAQQRLIDISCAVAAESRASGSSGGWYRWQDGGNWNLNDGNKARFWDSISRFPPEFRTLGHELVSMAAQRFERHLAEPASKFEARVGALNYYTARGRMGWHVDDTNFAKASSPIVMANLGDSADFGYKARKSDMDNTVRLDSGDVIVFGGPSRDLVHALLQVHPRTTPPELRWPDIPGKGRISVTWRDVGPEDGLTFNSDERLGLKVTENTLPRYRPKHGKRGYGV